MALILVVDDSASMRNMVTATLQSADHQVQSAGDGRAALSLAKSTKFDAVIADLNMPIMDGIELVKNLRALPAYKYTPLLLLTTEAAADKKTQGKQVGATGWLIKPFNPEKLIATIARVLN